MGSPSLDFACRPLEFETLPGHERITVQGVFNVEIRHMVFEIVPSAELIVREEVGALVLDVTALGTVT